MILTTKPSASPAPFLSDDVLKYLIPTAVTLFVFTLGLIATWLKANLERRRRYRQLRGLFMTWVPNMAKPIDAMINNCNDFSERLLASQRLSAEGMAFVPSNAEKLAGMDIQELIKAFLYNSTGNQQSNNEQLYIMISNLDYLANLSPEMKAKYDEHYTDTNLLLKDWNTAFIKLSDLQGKLFSYQNEKSKARVNLETHLFTNIMTWNTLLKANPQNTKITFDHLLMPNLTAIAEYFKETHSQEQDLIDLIAEIQNVLIIYNQWRANHEGYAKVFTNYGLKLKESFERLKATVDYFKNETRVKRVTS